MGSTITHVVHFAQGTIDMTNTSISPDAARSAAVTPAAVADLHEIMDALYRFGAGQDLRDRELFESAFTPDATVDFTGPAQRFGVTLPVFVGRAAITDTIMGTTAGLATTHSVTNPRITIRGDRATLRALVEAQHVPRDEPARHLLLKNWYAVELLRQNGGWAIHRMVIDNVWFTGDPTVLFPAL